MDYRAGAGPKWNDSTTLLTLLLFELNLILLCLGSSGQIWRTSWRSDATVFKMGGGGGGRGENSGCAVPLNKQKIHVDNYFYYYRPPAATNTDRRRLFYRPLSVAGEEWPGRQFTGHCASCFPPVVGRPL